MHIKTARETNKIRYLTRKGLGKFKAREFETWEAI
jgi:hypothetical protein